MAKKVGIIGENGNLDPYASLNGSKHIIRDASGVKPDENFLEFSNDFDVTDDQTNGKTIVAPNKSLVRQNEIASYILDGDKPSTALSSGTFFVDKNGLLRVANTNISTTDDVTDNNSSVKPIGDVLTELNSNIDILKTSTGVPSINTQYINTAYVHWLKSDKLVIVAGAINMNGTSVSSNTFLLDQVPQSAQNAFTTAVASDGEAFKMWITAGDQNIRKDENESIRSGWYNFNLCYLAQ